MRSKMNLLRIFGAALILAVTALFVMPDIAEAHRGGRSFGGSRRSFSRKSTPKTSKSRSTRQAQSRLPANKRTSFGGSRMTSAKQYTSKYGTPRKTQTITGKNAAGQSQRYVMHSYGGYGSSLMTGYMMGTTSWMWMMPFHPAFYYSRPYYVNNPDGTMGVYPPTFSWSKLIFTIIIVAAIAWIIYRIVRSKKQKGSRSYSQSSFR